VVEGITTAPDGLAIDLEHQHIYYTNMGNPATQSGFISRVDMDGKNHVVVVPLGKTYTPKQLTLELTLPTPKLYWCDREGMRVCRCNLDGTELEVLVKTGEGDEDRKDARNWCVGVAVDPVRQVLYWTQKGPSKGNKGRLFCAPLLLKANETAETRSDIRLILDNLPEPIDLDLDAQQQALYMTDRGDPPFGNTINRIDVRNHTSPKKEILVRKIHEAIGLALDLRHGKMYFSDLLGSLYSAKLDGSEQRILCPDEGDLTGVACVHGGY
jgi:DNA-binding beta-propeller fold protein YncE